MGIKFNGIENSNGIVNFDVSSSLKKVLKYLLVTNRLAIEVEVVTGEILTELLKMNLK